MNDELETHYDHRPQDAGAGESAPRVLSLPYRKGLDKKFCSLLWSGRGRSFGATAKSLDVHDCDKNIAYHFWSIEPDCSIRIEQSRHRIDPNRRMIVDAIKVWSHKDKRYIEDLGADQEDRDREFESFEKANDYIAAICSRPQFKRKDYVARYVMEYV
jgi:hypothetical protein